MLFYHLLPACETNKFRTTQNTQPLYSTETATSVVYNILSPIGSVSWYRPPPFQAKFLLWHLTSLYVNLHSCIGASSSDIFVHDAAQSFVRKNFCFHMHFIRRFYQCDCNSPLKPPWLSGLANFSRNSAAQSWSDSRQYFSLTLRQYSLLQAHQANIHQPISFKVHHILPEWTKNSPHSITIWDIDTKVVPLYSVD